MATIHRKIDGVCYSAEMPEMRKIALPGDPEEEGNDYELNAEKARAILPEGIDPYDLVDYQICATCNEDNV
jgi:hypothetical protein